jgi:hypothetical protein
MDMVITQPPDIPQAMVSEWVPEPEQGPGYLWD